MSLRTRYVPYIIVMNGRQSKDKDGKIQGIINDWNFLCKQYADITSGIKF